MLISTYVYAIYFFLVEKHMNIPNNDKIKNHSYQ